MVFRSRMMVGFCLLGVAGAVRAGTFADAVVEYVPGAISSSTLQQSGNAAIGLPTSVDDGETSPFTPPFKASDITIIGAGGHITLHFTEPVISAGSADIGVFTNTGIVARVSGGVVSAGNPVGTFSTDTAIVSVSADDTDWVTLNGGNPLDLTMPSNAFADAKISASGGISVSGGVVPADPYKPFTGTLSDFAGLTYPEMLTLLDGSFGGAWINTSGTGLAEINYIRFDVPTGDRLVLDAVTAANAVPEPASLGMLAVGGVILMRRRRCVSVVR